MATKGRATPGQPKRATRVPPSLPASLTGASLPRDDLAEEAALSALHFDGLDISARVSRLVDIEGCLFEATSLAGGQLDKVTLIDSVFRQCDLANVRLTHSSLARVALTGCRTTGLVVTGSTLRHVTLRDCMADLSVFRFATLTNVELVDCRLQGADFFSADLGGAVFRRCDLTRGEFSQAKARGAVFVDCVWDGVRGVSSLAGATIVHGSPLDAHAFMVATATGLGIRLGDPADYPELG